MERINGKLHSPLLPFSECQVGSDARALCTLLCMGLPRAAEPGTRACTVLGCDHIQRGKQPEKLGAASQRCQESSCCVWRIHHSTISLWYRRAGEPLLPGTGILPSKCHWLLKLMSGNSPYTGAASLPPAGAAASAEFRAH